MDETAKLKIMDKALRLLSQRAHSAQELATKLSRGKDASAELTVYALSECRRLNLLNDAAFARDLAAELAARGCGELRIRLELRKRGVSPDDACGALTAVREDEPARAEAAARFKLKSIRADDPPRKKQEKLYRFLLSRGFPPPTALAAMRKALE
ncbi:Regulatory protein RecX [bioreactor metagenome]|uniref:Regulatory protein RecX n=1 Tax=bioreactor metagenome TaxID=1076179 RepID=A0A645EJP6_9ZZZZ|nr:regulatory protein RecX [Victivallaceae bacterium]